MDGMDDLIVFLRARLDKDEQIARRACKYAEAAWHLDDEDDGTVLWWPPEPHIAEKEREHGLPVVSDQWRGETMGSGGEQIAPHIARHDPARVLAEVDAKRQLINWVLRWPLRPHPPSSVDGVLELLALPYADHEDYRPEWRP